MGYNPTYAPEMSREEMEMYLSDYKGVVINTRCAISRETIERNKSLQWIARLGSGLDIIDLDAAAEHQVHVLSAPEGNAQAVAEHAMGMLLCLANNLLQADAGVREGLWQREQNRGWEIDGKTIGIIGYGNNGSAFGSLWKGWNVSVLAYDKYLENYGDEDVVPVEMDMLLEQADIISLHIPLTEETRDMINADFLSKCKPGCVIVNTSRGKILDLQALFDALKSNHIKGVCLDVFPVEPPSQGTDSYRDLMDRLYVMKNVVLSPHIAGWTVESKSKIAEVLLGKLSVVSSQ